MTMRGGGVGTIEPALHTAGVPLVPVQPLCGENWSRVVDQEAWIACYQPTELADSVNICDGRGQGFVTVGGRLAGLTLDSCIELWDYSDMGVRFQLLSYFRDWIADSSDGSPAVNLDRVLADQRPLKISGASSREIVAGQPVRLSITGGSGSGQVSLEVVSTGDEVDLATAQEECDISGSGTRYTVRSTTLRECQFRAFKAADSVYRSVESDVVTVRFTKPAKQRPLRIVNSVTERVERQGTAIEIRTSGGSVVDGIVTVNLLEGPCSVDPIFTHLVDGDSPGRCRVTATLAGSGIYGDVTSRPVWITFRGEQPILSIAGSENGPQFVPASRSLRLGTTGGAGSGKVTYSLGPDNSEPGCQLRGNRLSISRTQPPVEWPVECQVVATKAASGLFLAASSVEAYFLFERVDQRPLRVIGPRNNSVLEGSIASVRVTGGSGKGAVGLVAEEPECIVTQVTRGWQISRLGVGQCTISVTKEAEGIYREATVSSFVAFNPGP